MNKIEFLYNRDKYKGVDSTPFLQHYGILGQKWGQRRWQNADGTFNEEGKQRYFGTGKRNGSSDEDKLGSAKSEAKDYLKFRNKMLKERTRPDLNQWYREQHKKDDRLFVKNAKKVDKSREKMYKDQLKDFYDDPNELVNDLKNVYKISGQRNSKIEKIIKDDIDRRNTEMAEDENEDMLIGGSSDRKAYKAQVKELKRQAKEMGIPFGQRGHLAKYCAKNGIDEITEEIVEGHKAGNTLYNDSVRMNNSADQIQHYVRAAERSANVREDKNVKKFTENNQNFKDYQKNVEKMDKVLEEANKELISKLKKAGLDVTPILTDSGKGYDTVKLNYYKEGSNEYQILDKAFQEVYSGRLQTDYKKYAKEARASLGHFEKDCHDFAKSYLVDQAEYNDPYYYAYTYEKDTGKTRSTKIYETFGYLMTEPYWDEVGGA